MERCVEAHLAGREAVPGAHGAQQPRHVVGLAGARVRPDERVVATVVGGDARGAHAHGQHRLRVRQPAPAGTKEGQAAAGESGQQRTRVRGWCDQSSRLRNQQGDGSRP